MAPINLPDGTEVSEVILPDGATASEVLAPDGSTVFDAIPDSAIHRWILDTVGDGTAEDSIGSADGSVTGVSSVSSADYQDGAAGEGDGSDDNIQTSTLGSFGSDMDTDFAIAFSIDNYGGAASAFGIRLTGASGNMGCNVELSQANSGDIQLDLADTDGDTFRERTSNGGYIDDNNLHRVLLNKTGNTVGDIQVFIADAGDGSYSAVSMTNEFQQGFDTVEDFTDDFTLFATMDDGSINRFVPAVFDDIILYDNSLSSAERDSDLSAQPAFG
jgi:hypothetical protein